MFGYPLTFTYSELEENTIFIGKSTINGTFFYSYVSLPKGNFGSCISKLSKSVLYHVQCFLFFRTRNTETAAKSAKAMNPPEPVRVKNIVNFIYPISSIVYLPKHVGLQKVSQSCRPLYIYLFISLSLCIYIYVYTYVYIYISMCNKYIYIYYYYY